MTPKFVPVMVTDVPAGPEGGDKFEMAGVGGGGFVATVKGTPALATPLTVTITFPVAAPAGTGTTIEVALQLAGAAGMPLNVTVLAP